MTLCTKWTKQWKITIHHPVILISHLDPSPPDHTCTVASFFNHTKHTTILGLHFVFPSRELQLDILTILTIVACCSSHITNHELSTCSSPIHPSPFAPNNHQHHPPAFDTPQHQPFTQQPPPHSLTPHPNHLPHYITTCHHMCSPSTITPLPHLPSRHTTPLSTQTPLIPFYKITSPSSHHIIESSSLSPYPFSQSHRHPHSTRHHHHHDTPPPRPPPKLSLPQPQMQQHSNHLMKSFPLRPHHSLTHPQSRHSI